MTSRTRYFTRTTQETLGVCRSCSTSWEITAPVEPHLMKEEGFELVDGAWTGLCEGCQEKQTEASNREYEALVRAAAELGRIHHTSALAFQTIPEGEGFDLEGSRWFGFWAMAGAWNPDGVDRFVRSAQAIVDNLNTNRGTELRVNLNTAKTQAVIHGRVE